MMSTNFRNVLATILFNLSVNIMLVRYLVVSRLLLLVAKCAIYVFINFNKVAGLRFLRKAIKKETLAQVFSCEF